MLVAAVLAIISWSALALQLWLTVRHVMVDGHDVMFGFLRNFSYFTVLTNTVAALVLTAAATSSDAYSQWSSASVRGATTAYMAMVGIVYTLVLRESWNPRGLQKFADVVLHDFMPVAFVLLWVVFWRTGSLRASGVPSWLIYPLTYLAYCVVHGAITRWYPYPFIDVGILGYPRMLANAIGITLAFAALSLVVVALDRARVIPRLMPSPHVRS